MQQEKSTILLSILIISFLQMNSMLSAETSHQLVTNQSSCDCAPYLPQELEKSFIFYAVRDLQEIIDIETALSVPLVCKRWEHILKNEQFCSGMLEKIVPLNCAHTRMKKIYDSTFYKAAIFKQIKKLKNNNNLGYFHYDVYAEPFHCYLGDDPLRLVDNIEVHLSSKKFDTFNDLLAKDDPYLIKSYFFDCSKSIKSNRFLPSKIGHLDICIMEGQYEIAKKLIEKGYKLQGSLSELIHCCKNDSDTHTQLLKVIELLIPKDSIQYHQQDLRDILIVAFKKYRVDVVNYALERLDNIDEIPVTTVINNNSCLNSVVSSAVFNIQSNTFDYTSHHILAASPLWIALCYSGSGSEEQCIQKINWIQQLTTKKATKTIDCAGKECTSQQIWQQCDFVYRALPTDELKAKFKKHTLSIIINQSMREEKQ